MLQARNVFPGNVLSLVDKVIIMRAKVRDAAPPPPPPPQYHSRRSANRVNIYHQLDQTSQLILFSTQTVMKLGEAFKKHYLFGEEHHKPKGIL